MKIARILSLALCLLMIFSLVACGAPTNDDNKDEDKEPTTVAEYVSKINEAMKNIKVKVTSKNTETTNGIDVVTTSVTYADGENYITEVEGSTNTFVDDTLYVSMPIVNMKNKLSGATQKAKEVGQVVALVYGIDETNTGVNAYKSSSFKKNDDGTVTLVFSNNSESVENLVDKITGSIGVPGSADLGESSQIVVIDKNYRILSITESHEITASASGISITRTQKTEETYTYDEAFEVKAPEDAAEYKEVSSWYELFTQVGE